MVQSIILGGGCFWCLEALFLQVRGVESVVSGYSGGVSKNPTYEEVSTGKTNHAEVVHITFDEEIIGLEEILDIFWHVHDPTTLNSQGADRGTQYRSAIFYQNENQLQAIQKVLQAVQADWEEPIVTQVDILNSFYPAEEYHQNYFYKNPDKGYCRVVINPKLQKLREKYFVKLK
ncbi:MAG: peptide-methionine (S)-S-oxide reductase MsrA [Patescibacteria group bacterium]